MVFKFYFVTIKIEIIKPLDWCNDLLLRGKSNININICPRFNFQNFGYFFLNIFPRKDLNKYFSDGKTLRPPREDAALQLMVPRCSRWNFKTLTNCTAINACIRVERK